MTAIVALEQARPSDLVRVSSQAAGIGGSTVYLRAGESLSVGELVRAMLIPSANDAATALALHVGNGSATRFVSLMNAKARELGLVDTTFANPHGLDEPGHVSSARDATLLVRHALGVPSDPRRARADLLLARGQAANSPPRTTCSRAGPRSSAGRRVTRRARAGRRRRPHRDAARPSTGPFSASTRAKDETTPCASCSSSGSTATSGFP